MTTTTEQRPEAERARWLLSLLERRGDEVLASWTGLQQHGGAPLDAGGDERDLRAQGGSVLDALRDGLRSGTVDDLGVRAFEPLRRLLTDVSVRGARAGATPSETATSVLALREALFTAVQADDGDGHGSAEAEGALDLHEAARTTGRLVDGLALLTFETFVRSREDVISRQNNQLMELSTPVVRLWDGVVGVPLVGTLDSSRAQVVMETLLQAIVDEHATQAILDITGVPTVDTLVAQHLLKTVTATRLMGADCIISGIGPQTAQTIVQLGIDLTGTTTRSTLADALETAIQRVEGGRADVRPEGA